jgi:hypothetical protein
MPMMPKSLVTLTHPTGQVRKSSSSPLRRPGASTCRPPPNPTTG